MITRFALFFSLIVCIGIGYGQENKALGIIGFKDACTYGFSPDSSGIQNTIALQKAVENGGTIIVSKPGIYKIAGTVYIGSYTTLQFGNNVFLKKVNEKGLFSHVLLNKGALTKTYDEHIVIDGLQIMVNGMDKQTNEVFGLRGHLAFFYVKDLRITHFRCLDVMKQQYCIHVCTFDDLIVDDAIIKGDKDGVHLGKGQRFRISNCVFNTYDDAVALNAHDYATGNPELGWIEKGIIENCWDLKGAEKDTVGYFCRIIAGGWIDWKKGMQVQQSDAIVSNGRIYRVKAKPDGTVYTSLTQPIHDTGVSTLDGINWVMVQKDTIHTCGVKNVIFKNIFLEKPRIALSIHFDNDKYSRSYYPGAAIPMQKQFTFDNIRVLFNNEKPFLDVKTPVDVVTISNSSINNNTIRFLSNKAMKDYFKTSINIYGCVFNCNASYNLITNEIDKKEIHLKTFGNMVMNNGFKAGIISGGGRFLVDSDLIGLEKISKSVESK